MSKKTKKNVQSVKEQKLEGVKAAETAETPVPAGVLSQTSQTASPEPGGKKETVSAVPIDIKTLPLGKIKEAEGMIGFPLADVLKKTIDWMGTVEERLKLIEETLPQKIQDSFKKVIADVQKEQQTQPAASTGNVGGGGLGSLLQFLPSVLGSGGGSSAMQDKILDMAVESMGLGNALVRAIIVKTAPEMAATLLKPYEKKEGT